MEKWSAPRCVTDPDGAGRDSCLVNMSRCLAAHRRSIQSLPGQTLSEQEQNGGTKVKKVATTAATQSQCVKVKGKFRLRHS